MVLICVFFTTVQINVVTQRGFVPVDERMQVLDSEGKPVSVLSNIKCYFCLVGVYGWCLHL